MTETIKLYFDTLMNKYEDEVMLTAPDSTDERLKQIPTALHALYKFTSKVNLPFGEIYPIEVAIQQSERNPFKPDWFVFGQDNYFSYWLCSFTADEEGLSFTYWDHECGNEVEEAVWSNVISFLEEIEKEYES